MEEVVILNDHPELQASAASLLRDTFLAVGNDHWANEKDSHEDVIECVTRPNVAVGLLLSGKLAGWVGIRPMYDKVWELHPLVVGVEYQMKGIGTRLLEEIETIARGLGLSGLFLGSDDEDFRTSLSAIDILDSNVLEALSTIVNLNRHPFEFYRKNGYFVVGIVPDANGRRKPDILMWKRL